MLRRRKKSRRHVDRRYSNSGKGCHYIELPLYSEVENLGKPIRRGGGGMTQYLGVEIGLKELLTSKFQLYGFKNYLQIYYRGIHL